ncbi:diguanylate cyclase [Spirochaetota bacterium]
MATKATIKKYRQQIQDLLKNDIEKSFINNELIKLDTQKHQKEFLSKTLELFVHHSFDEEEAKEHWNSIFKNYEDLDKKLKRNVTLKLAVFDYFLNLDKILYNPILVEVHLFRSTEELAIIDALTGLYNRRFYDEIIEREISRALEHQHKVSLLLIDIDDLKAVNDENGHLFGDQVIKTTALIIRDVFTDEDISCRYGGDEFAVIMPDTNEKESLKKANAFRNKFKKDLFIKKNKITISGGIATYPSDGITSKILMQRANRSMYKSKYSGKDMVFHEQGRKARLRRFKRSWKISFQPIKSTFQNEKFKYFVTKDISIGGVKIESNTQYELNTKVLIQLSLPNKERIFVVGNVVWSKRVKSNKYTYGVQFYDLNTDQINKMKKVLPTNYSVPEL